MAQEALVLSPQANASLLSGASTTVEIERGVRDLYSVLSICLALI